MATYDNSYAAQLKINPATPNLRGMSDNFSNDGQTNLGGYGLGEIFQLDYDRNKIEQIFNQGTDAQYALMQKEAQVAENNYANQQFQNQFNTIESLRAQRNEQIASGMARGLNAASDQATALGVQQEAMNGALELAQNRQMQADQIAAEYAQNVVKALQEANAVKQAMAGVAGTLYEADMLGYTGELSALGQLDANASDRYGYDLGLEGTKYTADQNLAGALDYNNKYLEGLRYSADRQYAAAVDAARVTAAAASRGGSGYGNVSEDIILQAYERSNGDYSRMVDILTENGYTSSKARNIASGYFQNYIASQQAQNPILNSLDSEIVKRTVQQQAYNNSQNTKTPRASNTLGTDLSNWDKLALLGYNTYSRTK
jgi:hypothetical protein